MPALIPTEHMLLERLRLLRQSDINRLIVEMEWFLSKTPTLIREGNYLTWLNPAAANLLGAPREEIVGCHVGSFASCEEDAETFEERKRIIARGQEPPVARMTVRNRTTGVRYPVWAFSFPSPFNPAQRVIMLPGADLVPLRAVA